MGRIAIHGVTKVFPGGVRAVDGVSLTVEEGEFIVLVGPSGCGKTTLLRMIAGLEEVTEGRIMIGARDVTHLPPRDRDIAMVFQNYALYPHMTVRKNLGYGLKVRGTPKPDVIRRVDDVALMLGLEDYLGRRPSTLSGGQRQRVAIGRATVREPVAFLMDEPLSNLDAKLRVMMRGELARLHQRLGVTTVYVTHDQVEAMTLGHRVAVLRDGVIQQVDRPQTLYQRPANLFVAAFIGSPSMNLVAAAVQDGHVQVGGHSIPLDPVTRPKSIAQDRVILGIRPEGFEDARFADPDWPQIEVDVDVVEELGADAIVSFSVDAPRLEGGDLRAAADGEDEALLAREKATFTARVDPRSEARVGARMRLAVDPSRFHFFDLATGAVLDGGGNGQRHSAAQHPTTARHPAHRDPHASRR